MCFLIQVFSNKTHFEKKGLYTNRKKPGPFEVGCDPVSKLAKTSLDLFLSDYDRSTHRPRNPPLVPLIHLQLRERLQTAAGMV